jgi:hypothetical protein
MARCWCGRSEFGRRQPQPRTDRLMLARRNRAGLGPARPLLSPQLIKCCASCREEKPASYFYANGSGQLSARCKSCHGLAPRTCIVCGSSFIGRSNAKLCSDICRRLHRPQTFLTCFYCGQRFGPVSHLRRKFCSRACKIAAQTTGRKPAQTPTPEARRAHGVVAYYVKTGKLKRPSSCSACGRTGRIEAAHENYDDPLAIRWLCKSCHSRWDWHEPKGGAMPSVRFVSQTAEASAPWGESIRVALNTRGSEAPL